MKKLVKAIKLGAKFREDSYDHLTATARSNKGEMVDFNQFYGITMREAAEKATKLVGFDPIDVEPVYLLLNLCWNDILAWAEKH
jgi:hypothetical protein